MKSIIIGFSKPKNHSFPIFSWIIRFVDWAPYSHVYIRWNSKSIDRDLIYQASGISVHFLSGKKFDQKAESLFKYQIEINESLKYKTIQKCVDNLGSPYGIKQALGIGIVKLFRLFGKDIKNPFADGNATWVCSELVLDVLKDLGMKININADNVTPKDIQKFLESQVKNGNVKVTH